MNYPQATLVSSGQDVYLTSNTTGPNKPDVLSAEEFALLTLLYFVFVAAKRYTLPGWVLKSFTTVAGS